MRSGGSVRPAELVWRTRHRPLQLPIDIEFHFLDSAPVRGCCGNRNWICNRRLVDWRRNRDSGKAARVIRVRMAVHIRARPLMVSEGVVPVVSTVVVAVCACVAISSAARATSQLPERGRPTCCR